MVYITVSLTKQRAVSATHYCYIVRISHVDSMVISSCNCSTWSTESTNSLWSEWLCK